MEGKQRTFSILMFPWLAHGHVFPYLELAKNLSTNNFHILFCSTPINLSSIKRVLENSPSSISIQLVELHLPSLPELPPEYHTTKNVPPSLMPKLFEAFKMSSSSFYSIISSLKPDMLIYDVFQTWAARHASSLGIPAVHFSTSGAAQYSLYYHQFASRDSVFPFEGIYYREHERKALEAVVNSWSRDKDDQDFFFHHFWLSCEIVLMKTCRGIEGKYIDYLSEMYQKKMVPVGSLIAPATIEQENHSEFMQWLSKKKHFSTIFISFGSENYLSKDQMAEIAKGLEICNVNFIWVVRSPHGQSVTIEEAMPKGFLEKVKDRGTILQGWAPQAKILEHPSVCAFVSHCGMSSMLESIYFGVPIIAIPLKLDQPLNARLAVEVGVGMEVLKDESDHFSSDEVANAINTVVLEETGESMRIKAAQLSQEMKNEQEDAIHATAEQLRRLCMEHNLHK